MQGEEQTAGHGVPGTTATILQRQGWGASIARSGPSFTAKWLKKSHLFTDIV